MVDPVNIGDRLRSVTRSSSEQNQRIGLAALATRRLSAQADNGANARAASLRIRPQAQPAETSQAAAPQTPATPAVATPTPAESQAATPTPAADSQAASAEVAAQPTPDNSQSSSQPQFIQPIPFDETPAAEASPTPPPAEQAPPPAALVRDAARAERVQLGLAVVSASRRQRSAQANTLQNGQTLGALRSTAPATQQTSSGLISPDAGRRTSSLFDLPSSGQGTINRLRAQVRPSSPLSALGRTDNSTSTSGALSSLRTANSQRAGLNSLFQSNDNASRGLLSTSNPNRTSGGFGLSPMQSSALDLLG